jgi:hypothetical protein
VVTALVGCRDDALKIDPCAVLPYDIRIYSVNCQAVPLNQPDKKEYERTVAPGDICISPAEYALTKKFYLNLIKKCGDKCQR